MGGCNSSLERTVKNERTNSLACPTIQENQHITVESPNRYDEEALMVFRKDFAENPELFILNNLIMSVQFFECFDTEIGKPASSKLERLNTKLIKEQSKQCIMPDTVFELVNKHLRFRPVHGPKKYESEPLVAQRLFVVYDNVEVLDLTDSAHYSGIDKPSYRVNLEECSRKGFVKLRQLEYIKPKSWNNNENGSSNSTSRSSVSSDEKNIIVDTQEPKPSTSKVTISPNNYDSSSDSYDYAMITQIKTPQPLDITLSEERSNSLPNNCFKPFKVKNIKKSNDFDEFEDRPLDAPPELFKTISYISSAGFMNHFKNTVFPNSLGKALGFDDKEIKKATSIPGTVFCSSFDSVGNTVQHEVIPAVRIQWPSHLTFEWKMRDDRPTIIDNRTTRRYKWPTDSMINQIVKLPCVVIPRGFIAKRGVNEDSTIEWEVGYPKVERFIESRMSHAQIRSFLTILTLHKTFIEPKTQKLGLLPEHIRILMYWECERNFLHWSENRLGHKLLSVLRNLYEHLGKGRLPDYFIRNKNVFENIPRKYLRPAQKILHEILESPLMFFVEALRNIRYKNSANFYPSLNYKKLLDILQNDGLQSVNPLVYKMAQRDRKMSENPRPKVASSESEWYRLYGQYNYTKKIQARRKQKETEDEENKKTAEETRKASINSVDLNYKIDKTIDTCKRISILRFFIEFFVEMSKKSLELATPNQSLLYAKQAWYLTKILEDIDGCKQETEEYHEIIQLQEDEAKRKAASLLNPPSTPKRNVSQFFIADHTKSKAINLTNLNNSYTSTIQENSKKSFKMNTRADVHEDSSNNRRRTIHFNSEIESTQI